MMILKCEGFEPFYLSNKWMKQNVMPIFNSIGGFYLQKKMWFLIRSGCEIVIQWPIYRYSEVEYLLKLIGRKNVRSTILVHDFDDLRQFRNSKEMDLKACQIAKRIIVLTNAMKQYLVDNRIEEDKIAVLESWDYLTDEDTPYRELTNKIAFCGNLEKSPFLKRWDEVKHYCAIMCYGTGLNCEFKSIEYKGRFNSGNVNAIEGSWGLVWDGDSIYECNGNYGNYLRYNAPHKFSLYMVAGLPVIVWSQSALAPYVQQKKLGIVVNSLTDIDKMIEKTTLKIYKMYRDNVIREAKDLKLGNHLKRIL